MKESQKISTLNTSPSDSAVGSSGINNGFYDSLGERWFEAWDDPVALLRAEGAVKNPWVAEKIEAVLGAGKNVLDVGCGAGFLGRVLSERGHRCIGMDMSFGSLKTARGRGENPLRSSGSLVGPEGPGSSDAPDAPKGSGRQACGKGDYLRADAYRLPVRENAFDAVTALDFLEHVEDPARVIAEAARALKPGGLFFFHTFNRNFLAWLVVIKGLEWFVRNTPARMHVLPLFIKPDEMRAHCRAAGLEVTEIRGLRPDVLRPAFWKMLVTRKVPQDFRFLFTDSLAISYLGCARKTGP